MVQLRGQLDQRFSKLEPSSTNDTVEAYKAWIDGPASSECLLFIAPGEAGEFAPAMDASKIMEAAAASGFSLIRSWQLPGPRSLQAWARSSCDVG